MLRTWGLVSAPTLQLAGEVTKAAAAAADAHAARPAFRAPPLIRFLNDVVRAPARPSVRQSSTAGGEPPSSPSPSSAPPLPPLSFRCPLLSLLQEYYDYKDDKEKRRREKEREGGGRTHSMTTATKEGGTFRPSGDRFPLHLRLLLPPSTFVRGEFLRRTQSGKGIASAPSAAAS